MGTFGIYGSGSKEHSDFFFEAERTKLLERGCELVAVFFRNQKQ